MSMLQFILYRLNSALAGLQLYKAGMWCSLRSSRCTGKLIPLFCYTDDISRPHWTYNVTDYEDLGRATLLILKIWVVRLYLL